MDYFELMMPQAMWNNFVEGTNAALLENNQQGITLPEMRRFFGITLSFALVPSIGPRSRRWAESADDDCFLLPQCYGKRTGMTRQRFDNVLRHLRTSKYTDEQLSGDPWTPVRCLYEAFNAHMPSVVDPGHYLLLDEIMSAWRGNDGKFAPTTAGGTWANVMPSNTKLKRRPRGVGSESKAMADGQTYIIMRLELCEGKQSMAERHPRQLPAHTAVSQRLVSPYKGTGRTVVAGAGFASVSTALTMARDGLYFIGQVKTEHNFFPKKYLEQDDLYESRGDAVCLSASVPIEGQTYGINAAGWNDKKRKLVVFTGGSMLQGTPHAVKRYRTGAKGDSEMYHKEVQRPKVVENMFDHYSGIDVHDHIRQGGLQLEVHWRTQKWIHRDIATFLGIIETNAYIAYNMEHPQQPMTHTEFLDELVAAMVKPTAATPQPQEAIPSIGHSLRPLTEIPYYAELRRARGAKYWPQVRCKECHKDTTMFCLQCTQLKWPTVLTSAVDEKPKKRLVGVHKPSRAHPDCHEKHLSK